MKSERLSDATKPAPWWALRRVTSGGHYLPSIDGLRFVAILGVVLYHLASQMVDKPDPAGPRFTEGGSLTFFFWGGNGVRLFFVISGFILALPYARARFGERKPPTVRAFYLRRLTRLEPPYILNIVVLFLLIPLANRGIGYGDLLPHLFTHLTYTHNLYNLKWDGMISPVNWSLEVELQFYLLVPLIMRVFRTRTAMTQGILLAGIVLFSAFDLFVRPQAGWVEHFLPAQAQFFLTGVLLAEIYSRRHERDRNLIRWDVLAVAAALVSIPLFGHIEYGSFLLIPMGIVLYASLASRFLSRILAFSPFAIVGGMCYTIYLWHFAIISFLWRFTTHLTSSNFDESLILQCIVILPAVFLICTVLFVLVERPCMDRDWPAKVWRIVSRRPAPQDVQPLVPPSAPEIVEEP